MGKQPSSHIPVLTKELLGCVSSALKESSDAWVLDGTFGRGGHTQAILENFPHVKAVALDVDIDAINWGETHVQHLYPGRIHFVHDNFTHYLDLVKYRFSSIMGKVKHFQCMILDLGLSSPQLESNKKGFGVYTEGPLDMRLDVSRSKMTAGELVNHLKEKELFDLFKDYVRAGGLRRVIKQMVHFRKTHPFHTTKDLAGFIEKYMGWRKRGSHPATHFFLALRVRVNRELEGLEKVLPDMIGTLSSEGGRMAVISFHSLEDRIVKRAFLKAKAEGKGKVITKKVITASYEERKKNPRARSAKLRVFERH